ncbi:hypothetical protein ES705_30382 [subsurface metagenome]
MSEKSFVYLRDIKNSINSIELFIKNMTFTQFQSDDKTSSAVIRKFEIIGEASKNIPKSIRKKYSRQCLYLRGFI